MKSRLSITIDERYAAALQRVSEQEHRSLSNQIEHIVGEWLRNRKLVDQVPVTQGRFVGSFSREDTYADD